MKSVSEVSKITGVSVRALHHYDAVGLLPPTAKTEKGYRLYDDKALERLQTILFFRELDFSLGEIKTILDCPGFDRNEALKDQIRLLRCRKERLEGLISLAENQLRKGETHMSFQPFDKETYDSYKQEAKERWGNTVQYRQQASRHYTEQKEQDAAVGLMNLFASFGKLKELPLEHGSVQQAVKDLQQYITEHFYPCSREMLFSLGEMYVSDDRFRQNIDAVGGEGTARFVRDAIMLTK